MTNAVASSFEHAHSRVVDNLAGVDGLFVVSFLLLVTTGWVMMGSASMEYASQHYGDAFYHVLRHGIYLLMASAAMIVCFFIAPSQWQRASVLLLFIAFLLLVLVLVPGIGKEVNGSKRWISLGLLNLQCSEIAKFFLVLYLAGYLVRREKEVQQEWVGLMKPLIVLALLIVLLLLEPDFGAVVVMMSAVLGMLFIARVKLGQFLVVIGVSGLAVSLMASLSPYRMQRLMTFLDPWPHQFDSGYQLVQALIAFGRGEWFGLGLGHSVQKLFYLPESHTDFVFAIIGEELGFVGAVTVIALFALFIGRILVIGRMAENLNEKFSAQCCYGIAFLFSAQVFINIGVNAGLLPTKGLTLPFFSYGGSSLLISFVMVALVVRVSQENSLRLLANTRRKRFVNKPAAVKQLNGQRGR